MRANYFKLYALAELYPLDLLVLEKRHLALQRRLHPDRHVGSTATQRRLAEEYTSYLNEAFRVLSNPLARAAYLLKLRGMDPFSEGDHVALPLDFLERQMELREQLEAMADRQDHTAAESLAKSLQDELNVAMDALSLLFETDKLSLAVEATRRLRYLVNCQSEATRLANS